MSRRERLRASPTRSTLARHELQQINIDWPNTPPGDMPPPRVSCYGSHGRRGAPSSRVGGQCERRANSRLVPPSVAVWFGVAADPSLTAASCGGQTRDLHCTGEMDFFRRGSAIRIYQVRHCVPALTASLGLSERSPFRLAINRLPTLRSVMYKHKPPSTERKCCA